MGLEWFREGRGGQRGMGHEGSRWKDGGVWGRDDGENER